jgi:hypothetical protein
MYGRVSFHFVVKIKNEAASPPDETASQIWGLHEIPPRPLIPHWRDDQSLKANCGRARANERRPVELLPRVSTEQHRPDICAFEQ